MDKFFGFKYEEITPDCNIQSAINSIDNADHIYLDTETMSFTGLCFLIQFTTNTEPKKVHLIKVLKHDPKDIMALIDKLVTKKLIIHNASFDLFHLSKLYTVSSMIESYSFEEIWEAERIWRPKECCYEDRLDKVYGVYPVDVVDTMLVAQHSLPSANELLGGTDDGHSRSKAFFINKFPYACIDELRQIFSSESVWKRLLRKQIDDDRWIDYLAMHKRIKISVKNSNTKEAKKKLTDDPAKYLVDLVISYDGKGVFKLKELAQHYQYIESDSLTSFEFLTGFSESAKLKKLEKGSRLPTIPDGDVYAKLYQYCKTGYVNPKFLEYSVRDILLLQLIYTNMPYETESSPSLQMDQSLLAYFANLRLYGLKLDKDVLKASRLELSNKINNQIIKLNREEPKLESPTSTPQVKDWLRIIISTYLNKPQDELDIEKLVPNTDKKTLKKLLHSYPDLNRLKDFAEFKKWDGIMRLLPVDIDSMFPNYNIYGTVTNRLTSRNPNAQQMPAEELARNYFIAPSDYSFVLGDFDQLELRIMAYVFGIKRLIKAFEAGRDPHTQMGVDIFFEDIQTVLGKPELLVDEVYEIVAEAKRKDENSEELTLDEKKVLKYRKIGKLLNFMIAYGTTDYGLAQELQCSQEEAQKHIDAYFEANPELKLAVESSDKVINRLKKVKHQNSHREYEKWELAPEPIPAIHNLLGLTRSFAVARTVMKILYYLNGRDYKGKYLSQYKSSILDKFSTSVIPGFKKIQGAIMREAFNFGIQSIGSYFTKQLQKEICSEFISTGSVHRVKDLALLPTLNVHDELHFYLKSKDDKEQLDLITERVLKNIGDFINGRISLKFDISHSWADKG